VSVTPYGDGMHKQRSRAWRVAERLGLVEEPRRRPVGSAAWWRRVALGAGVAVGTFIAIRVVGVLG
jgi:hypothetical protein